MYTQFREKCPHQRKTLFTNQISFLKTISTLKKKIFFHKIKNEENKENCNNNNRSFPLGEGVEKKNLFMYFILVEQEKNYLKIKSLIRVGKYEGEEKVCVPCYKRTSCYKSVFFNGTGSLSKKKNKLLVIRK